MSANGVVHINLKVDPAACRPREQQAEQLGRGARATTWPPVQITPHQPARPGHDVGRDLSHRRPVGRLARGDRPDQQHVLRRRPGDPGAGRPDARRGDARDGPSDVTIGSIAVPPIAAWQTVNVEQSFTLPVTPPLLLNGASQFTLSVLPDADLPHQRASTRTARSAVWESTRPTVNITVPPGTTPPALGALPDLAAGAVTASSDDPVLGPELPGSGGGPESRDGRSRARSASGSCWSAPAATRAMGIFLGDTIVQGLPPGSSQHVTQTLTLPYRLPAGDHPQQPGHRHDRRGPRPRERAQRDLQEQQRRRPPGPSPCGSWAPTGRASCPTCRRPRSSCRSMPTGRPSAIADRRQ